jgi:phosphoribosylaminoimidazole-succinocarboxamide synthase
MKKGKKLYEGKAKIIYATSDKNLVIQYFKDDATAFNNQKKSTIEGKGVLNNRISEHILSNLNQIGIKNHLVKRLNMREQLVKFVDIIPIEFIVRNIATGSLTKRLGIEENGKNNIILADEISPDTCRLWDSITDKKLDKDRFRKDLGDLIPAYTEVAKRLGILHEHSNVSAVNVTKLSSIKKKSK